MSAIGQEETLGKLLLSRRTVRGSRRIGHALEVVRYLRSARRCAAAAVSGCNMTSGGCRPQLLGRGGYANGVVTR